MSDRKRIQKRLRRYIHHPDPIVCSSEGVSPYSKAEERLLRAIFGVRADLSKELEDMDVVVLDVQTSPSSPPQASSGSTPRFHIGMGVLVDVDPELARE